MEIINKPTSIFKGIPTTNTFICGIVLANIPNNKSIKNTIAIIGIANLKPVTKVLDNIFINEKAILSLKVNLPMGIYS